MSIIGQMRQNIVSGLAGLTGLANVRVLPATAPDDWLFHAGKPGPTILVVHVGLEATGNQTIVPRTQTGVVTNWLIIAIGTDYQSGSGALTKALGTDDLAEAIRGIRDVSIGPTGQPRVDLRLRAETLVEHPERSAAGGPVAVFCTYQSGYVVV